MKNIRKNSVLFFILCILSLTCYVAVKDHLSLTDINGYEYVEGKITEVSVHKQTEIDLGYLRTATVEYIVDGMQYYEVGVSVSSPHFKGGSVNVYYNIENPRKCFVDVDVFPLRALPFKILKIAEIIISISSFILFILFKKFEGEEDNSL